MARPKTTNPLVAGGGAAIGAMLGGPLGAMAGAGIGALLGEETPSLEDALRVALGQRGYEFVSLRSLTPTSIVVLYKAPDAYRTIKAEAPDSGRVDDDLYDRVLGQIEGGGVLHAGHP